MINSMTTNDRKNKTLIAGLRTEFQLHKSQLTVFNGILNKICDYSEYKLACYIDETIDKQQKLILIALLRDYKLGHIAIAWKHGKPVWIKVVKD